MDDLPARRPPVFESRTMKPEHLKDLCNELSRGLVPIRLLPHIQAFVGMETFYQRTPNTNFQTPGDPAELDLVTEKLDSLGLVLGMLIGGGGFPFIFKK